MKPYNLVERYREETADSILSPEDGIFYFEAGCNMVLRNVGDHLQKYTVSHSRRDCTYCCYVTCSARLQWLSWRFHILLTAESLLASWRGLLLQCWGSGIVKLCDNLGFHSGSVDDSGLVVWVVQLLNVKTVHPRRSESFVTRQSKVLATVYRLTQFHTSERK